MDDVYVLGAGMTAFGKRTDRSLAELTAEAVHASLEDACCDAHDVQAACFSNAGQGAIEGQHMISGQIALRRIGLGGIPVLNVENACASASTAFHLACLYVKAGAADIVLAVGAEKMVTPQKERAFELLRGAPLVAHRAVAARGPRLDDRGAIEPVGEQRPIESR